MLPIWKQCFMKIKIFYGNTSSGINCIFHPQGIQKFDNSETALCSLINWILEYNALKGKWSNGKWNKNLTSTVAVTEYA